MRERKREWVIESDDDWREKKTNKEREREHVRDRNLKVRNREWEKALKRDIRLKRMERKRKTDLHAKVGKYVRWGKKKSTHKAIKKEKEIINKEPKRKI